MNAARLGPSRITRKKRVVCIAITNGRSTGLAAAKRSITLPAEPVIDAEVDLIVADGGSSLRARFKVSLPGVARDVAQSLVDEAHRNCPYSKATRGNMDVAVRLV